MRALVKTANGQGNLEMRDVPVPQVDAGEVLIRVRACGICGSDLKIQDDQHPYTPPVVIGHEFAGETVEIGAEVSAIRPRRFRGKQSVWVEQFWADIKKHYGKKGNAS